MERVTRSRARALGNSSVGPNATVSPSIPSAPFSVDAPTQASTSSRVTKAKGKAKAKPKAEADAKAKATPKAAAKAKAKAEVKTKAKAEVNDKTKAKAEVKPKADVKARASTAATSCRAGSKRKANDDDVDNADKDATSLPKTRGRAAKKARVEADSESAKADGVVNKETSSRKRNAAAMTEENVASPSTIGSKSSTSRPMRKARGTAAKKAALEQPDEESREPEQDGQDEEVSRPAKKAKTKKTAAGTTSGAGTRASAVRKPISNGARATRASTRLAQSAASSRIGISQDAVSEDEPASAEKSPRENIGDSQVAVSDVESASAEETALENNHKTKMDAIIASTSTSHSPAGPADTVKMPEDSIKSPGESANDVALKLLATIATEMAGESSEAAAKKSLLQSPPKPAMESKLVTASSSLPSATKKQVAVESTPMRAATDTQLPVESPLDDGPPIGENSSLFTPREMRAAANAEGPLDGGSPIGENSSLFTPREMRTSTKNQAPASSAGLTLPTAAKTEKPVMGLSLPMPMPAVANTQKPVMGLSLPMPMPAAAKTQMPGTGLSLPMPMPAANKTQLPVDSTPVRSPNKTQVPYEMSPLSGDDSEVLSGTPRRSSMKRTAGSALSNPSASKKQRLGTTKAGDVKFAAEAGVLTDAAEAGDLGVGADRVDFPGRLSAVLPRLADPALRPQGERTTSGHGAVKVGQDSTDTAKDDGSSLANETDTSLDQDMDVTVGHAQYAMDVHDHLAGATGNSVAMDGEAREVAGKGQSEGIASTPAPSKSKPMSSTPRLDLCERLLAQWKGKELALERLRTERILAQRAPDKYVPRSPSMHFALLVAHKALWAIEVDWAMEMTSTPNKERDESLVMPDDKDARYAHAVAAASELRKASVDEVKQLQLQLAGHSLDAEFALAEEALEREIAEVKQAYGDADSALTVDRELLAHFGGDDSVDHTLFDHALIDPALFGSMTPADVNRRASTASTASALTPASHLVGSYDSRGGDENGWPIRTGQWSTPVPRPFTRLGYPAMSQSPVSASPSPAQQVTPVAAPANRVTSNSAPVMGRMRHAPAGSMAPPSTTLLGRVLDPRRNSARHVPAESSPLRRVWNAITKGG